MRRIWTLLLQPNETVLADWLQRLAGAQVRRGSLALVSNAEASQTIDGKAIGVLDGVIFNYAAAALPLLGRGAPITDDASLAVHAVGWSGQPGLGALRWHGTLAVLHQAQRAAIVARDWQGVGGLYWAQAADAHVFGNDRGALATLGLAPRLVPPGMTATCAPGGVQWQPMATQAEARAWFRELPDELLAPSDAIWRAGLHDRLVAALDACLRAHPRLQRGQAGDRAGAWLQQELPLAPSPVADALWTLDGADAWLGLAAVAPLPVVPGPWPLPEPPEPLRVAEPEAQARRVRATWLADVALEQARAAAAARDVPLLAPHLDPAVLAWLGAMPPALRPLA